MPLTADQRYAQCETLVAGPSIEAGYVVDQGGPTNHGITLSTLSHWRGVPCTAEDVQELGLPETAAIYRSLYWAPIGGDGLPSGVDLMVFDAAVNQGPGTAAGFLQAAVGVTVDRHIGPQTLAAVAATDPVSLIRGISAERMNSYQEDAGWDEDGKGWTARVNKIETTATAWAQRPQ